MFALKLELGYPTHETIKFCLKYDTLKVVGTRAVYGRQDTALNVDTVQVDTSKDTELKLIRGKV